jgi:hypothetical protein
MCRMSSIKMMVMVLAYVKVLFGIILFFVGTFLSSDINVLEAFSYDFSTYGSVVSFMAFLSIAVVMPHRWSTQKHNRFVIFCSWCIDTIVFSVLVYMGYTITSYTYPLFPKDMQLDCLSNTPVAYEESDCNEYFDSDRVSGMRLYWLYYFSTALEDTVSYQALTSIEQEICCGFFAPMQCREQPIPFPIDRPLDGIESSYISSRVSCGPVENFYPLTSVCSTFADITLGIVGGCNYDYGIGYCLDREIKEESLGCASDVEDITVGLITFPGGIVTVLAFLNLYAMLLQCCVWWKRKESDVFPKYKVDMGDNPKSSFHLVKDQFMVQPLSNTLQKKQFLPLPRLLRLEMERQQEQANKLQQQKAQEEKEYHLEDEKL